MLKKTILSSIALVFLGGQVAYADDKGGKPPPKMTADQAQEELVDGKVVSSKGKGKTTKPADAKTGSKK